MDEQVLKDALRALFEAREAIAIATPEIPPVRRR
jgi:hypothetical protein